MINSPPQFETQFQKTSLVYSLSEALIEVFFYRLIPFILFAYRKLKEEIKLKKHLIETDGGEIEDLQQQFQHSNEDVKKTSAEINSINMKVAESKRRIQELKVVVEMETPSLQMQMEELREIEAEINGLENNKRV